MITELPSGATGVWCVRTATSTYVLDLNESTLSRYPSRTAPQGWPSPAQLRKDGEHIPLLGFSTIAVGRPMLLILDIRRDGVQTVRQSTEVISIENVELPDGWG